MTNHESLTTNNRNLLEYRYKLAECQLSLEDPELLKEAGWTHGGYGQGDFDNMYIILLHLTITLHVRLFHILWITVRLNYSLQILKYLIDLGFKYSLLVKHRKVNTSLW